MATGFRLYTLPARLAYRRTASLLNLPDEPGRLIEEIRALSEQVAGEVQAVLDGVDRDMRERAAHLTPEQREQAAQLALYSAEQHLSMAAVNVLRALWLASPTRRLSHTPGAGIIADNAS